MSYFNLNLAVKTARLGQILAAIGSNAVLDLYAGGPPPTPDVTPLGALLASLPCAATFGTISNGIDNPVITAAGGGYTSIPTFALVGAVSGMGSQFQTVMQLSTMSVVSGGVNYAPNDILTLPALSATCLQPAVLQVTAVNASGVILAASIQQAGQFITTLPTAPVSEFETTGVGSGAAFDFSTFSVAAVNAILPGQGYTSAGASGTALFTGGGGSGASAVAPLTPILTANAITTVNAAAGGTAGLARISNSSGGGVVDLDVGQAGSGASVIITSTSIVSGGPVVVSSAFIVEA